MPVVAVFGDGGVIGPNPSKCGATFAWCHVDERGFRVKTGGGIIVPRDRWEASEKRQQQGRLIVSLPVPAATNNIAEMLALFDGLRALPSGWSGKVCSDSGVALGRIFDGFKWQGVPNEVFEMWGSIRRNLGELEKWHLAGHPTKEQLKSGFKERSGVKWPVSHHNRWCDAECSMLASEHHTWSPLKECAIVECSEVRRPGSWFCDQHLPRKGKKEGPNVGPDEQT